LAGEPNSYAYVSSNPVSLYDLWGLTQADINCMLALAKKTEKDLKFPTTAPVVEAMPSQLDTDGRPILQVGEYNHFSGTMHLSTYYLKPLSGVELVDLYYTIVHEALHKTRGMFSGSGKAHKAVYDEANRRSEAQSEAIKSGEAGCGCKK
jgi:hypothetical protein